MQSTCKHLKYHTQQARLDSYVGWPARYVPKTPEELSAAGFFYIGSADRVTCFQCGITLRDWEEEHDPVKEHRRYSEHCQFINNITPRDLGVLKRPITKSKVVTSGPSGQLQDNTGIDKLMNDLHLSDEACASTLPHSPQSDGNKKLVERSVCDKQENSQNINEEQQPGKVSNVEFLRRENFRLKQETQCRMCGHQRSNTLFLPCGHLLTCKECGNQAEHCILCGQVILGTVKTYRV